MTRALRSLAVVLVVVGASGCYRSTGSTEVGIKIGKLFGADEVVAPGRTVLVIPVVHDWYVFDTKTQTVEMKDSKNAREDDALDFKTRDGNDVSVDVTVLYHVDPAKAPHVLRHVARDVDEVRDVLVRPLARSIPRDSLNELHGGPQHKLLLVGLQGKHLAPAQLPPRNLVFLLDVSGSMNEPNKLPLLKRSLSTLVSTLNERDQVALVVYAGASGVVLPPTSGALST